MMKRVVFRLSQWIVQIWFRLQLRLRVRGVENIPRTGPVIIAANHVSAYDPPVIGSVIPRVCYFMAKKELFENFFLRSLLSFYHVLPVDREGLGLGTIRSLKTILSGGGALLMFPEGTRSKTGRLGEVKEGVGMLAVQSNTWIVPACISGIYQVKPSFLRRPKVTVTFGKAFPTGSIVDGCSDRREMYARVSVETFRALAALADDLNSKSQKDVCD